MLDLCIFLNWFRQDDFLTGESRTCLDSHSDGTHSLQRIHWWAIDVMLNFSKSVLMKKQIHPHLGWSEGEVNCQQIFSFGWTIPLTSSVYCVLYYFLFQNHHLSFSIWFRHCEYVIVHWVHFKHTLYQGVIKQITIHVYYTQASHLLLLTLLII